MATPTGDFEKKNSCWMYNSYYRKPEWILLIPSPSDGCFLCLCLITPSLYGGGLAIHRISAGSDQGGPATGDLVMLARCGIAVYYSNGSNSERGIYPMGPNHPVSSNHRESAMVALAIGVVNMPA